MIPAGCAFVVATGSFATDVALGPGHELGMGHAVAVGIACFSRSRWSLAAVGFYALTLLQVSWWVHDPGAWADPAIAGERALTGIGFLVVYAVSDRACRHRAAVRGWEELVRNSPDAQIRIDAEGRIVGWNPGAERLHGWSESEAIGRHAGDLVGPGDRLAFERELRRISEGGEPVLPDYESVDRNGEVLRVRRTLARLPDTKPPRAGVLLIERDIREDVTLKDELEVQRKIAISLLQDARRLEQRFRVTVESAPSGMVMADAEGRIVMVNSEAERLFGYDREEMIGERIERLVPERFREDHPALRAEYMARPVARRMGEGRELFGLRKDGSEFPVEIGLNPVRTPEGIFVLSAIVDITDRKEAEREREVYTKELERSNEELDEFAYIASHDLRSPLAGISRLAEWIEDDSGDVLGEDSRRHLALMKNRVGRMERLLQDLLQYSRVGRTEEKAERVDCGALLRGLVDLLERPEGFRIEVPDDLPTLLTARAPLELVFRNLIGNAIKHRDRDDGKAWVEWEDLGSEVAFTVADDGPGIDPRHHRRVFELFSVLQSRDRVEGSGMGLAVVKKTVERYGGRIEVDSQPGGGCRFRFTWPRRPAGGEGRVDPGGGPAED